MIGSTILQRRSQDSKKYQLRETCTNKVMQSSIEHHKTETRNKQICYVLRIKLEICKKCTTFTITNGTKRLFHEIIERSFLHELILLVLRSSRPSTLRITNSESLKVPENPSEAPIRLQNAFRG